VYSIPGFDGRAGISEVWLVDLAGQRLEIHRRPAAAGYQDFRLPGRIETFAALAFPDIAVTLPDLMP
jgi:Uma2 family endonuclease